MALGGKKVALVLLGVAVLIAFFEFNQKDDSRVSQSLPPLKTKRAPRPDDTHRRDARRMDEQDSLRVIRTQFALLLSDQPELASLEETLAACGRIQST